MEIRCCYGVYERLADGRWVYPWGEEVPGAQDITVRDVLALGLVDGASNAGGGTPPQRARADRLAGEGAIDGAGAPPEEQVVGMWAPELHVRAMVTVADIAEMLGVARDTVAAYRYRGYLPEPQAVVGRTPVWSRPIVRHWMESRPGNGWRTDIYGNRREYDEWVHHRRQTRRRQRVQQGPGLADAAAPTPGR